MMLFFLAGCLNSSALLWDATSGSHRMDTPCAFVVLPVPKSFSHFIQLLAVSVLLPLQSCLGSRVLQVMSPTISSYNYGGVDVQKLASRHVFLGWSRSSLTAGVWIPLQSLSHSITSNSDEGSIQLKALFFGFPLSAPPAAVCHSSPDSSTTGYVPSVPAGFSSPSAGKEQ